MGRPLPSFSRLIEREGLPDRHADRRAGDRPHDRRGHQLGDPRRMNTPQIQALGITQQGSPTRWKATGDVDGMGWLEAWGTTLIAAMEALHALVRERDRMSPAPAERNPPALPADDSEH